MEKEALVENIEEVLDEYNQDDQDNKVTMVQSSQAPTVTADSEWSRTGNCFYSGTRADKTSRIPGGVYKYVQPMGGRWFLERTQDKFEFPFNVYNACGNIINRVCNYWAKNGGNLGVLMNGLRGSGKTMTAQLIANELIRSANIPVLVVREPIPLQNVFETVKQDLIVIFDEFEKTHSEEASPGSQQSILSTIDGMSRSEHRRLILFITNSAAIDENLRDRPSRIHYKFEFDRVADEIIEGLINDSLPKHLMHFKPEIMQYLTARNICTIDIVKAVISEVKTFEESPLKFEGLLNIAKAEPLSYSIYIVDPTTNTDLEEITREFRINSPEESSLISGNKQAMQDLMYDGHPYALRYNSWAGCYTITLLEQADEQGYWLANLHLPKHKTIWREYLFLPNASLSLDKRPSDWQPLPSSERAAKSDKAREEIEKRYENSLSYSSVYGTGTPSVVKIRFVPNSREEHKENIRSLTNGLL